MFYVRDYCASCFLLCGVFSYSETFFVNRVLLKKVYSGFFLVTIFLGACEDLRLRDIFLLCVSGESYFCVPAEAPNNVW